MLRIFFFLNASSIQQQKHRTPQYISLNVEKKLQKRTLSYIAIYQKVHLLAIRESNDIQWEGWIGTV